jgi:hypothetical protein
MFFLLLEHNTYSEDDVEGGIKIKKTIYPFFS